MSPALRQLIEAHEPAARKWAVPLDVCGRHRKQAARLLREGRIEDAERNLDNAWWVLRHAHWAKGPVLP